jgi:hypothetical protein
MGAVKSTTLRALFSLVLWGLGPGASAQISPGELAKVHAAIDGSSGCLRCHAPNKGVDPDRCLSCHTALRARVTEGRGLHARPDYRNCQTCHIDHQGREADLRWWGPKGLAGFNHADTGYALAGKHATVLCARCHNPERVIDAPALARGGGSAARTYLGLSTTCAACHQDIHRGQFGKKDCGACHNQDSFKSSPRFDHSQTRYPLSGRHAAVACEKCHKTSGAGAETRRVYAGVPFASCSNCHADTHRGRLGSACASCHSTAGWSSILKTSNFDHSKTAYPLEGGHRAVSCDKCHKGALTTKIRHERCSDCHADSHRGEFKARADGGACESCHDVSSFATARFSVDEHQRSAYPLEGAHRAVACDQCHRRAPNQRTATYRVAHTRCLYCHVDAHRGAMDRYAGAKGCVACHNPMSWRAAAFDHSATSFPLTLGHATVACAACHKSLNTRGATERTSFTGLSSTCASCHSDVHAGQFARGGQTACERCHGGVSWKPAPGFDHNRDTAYPLDGRHAQVSCASCHRTEIKDGVSRTRYKPVGTACADCHTGRKT